MKIKLYPFNSFLPIIFISFSLLFLIEEGTSQSIQLNEIQASNTFYQDEDEDTPDWIELYNSSQENIDLAGWQLTDNIENDTYWNFDTYTLESGSYEYLWASGKMRKNSGSARSLVSEDQIFRYILPTQNISNTWKNIGYNDNVWNQGLGGFGYGDGDDNTIVPFGTRVVYVRKTFDIEDASKIAELYLDIDYDDAFVAYINGEEIARNNIDEAIPGYLSLANTDKEATMYSGGAPDHYDLQDFIALLRDGENVLAIQVYNNLASSSDLTLRPFLSARYTSISQDGSEIHPLLNYVSSRPHTDFKISSTSETIYLIEPSGSIHDSIQVSNMRTDISYGRTTNGSLGYFRTPTPGAINSENSYLGILSNELSFSHDGGLTEALNLTLSTSQPSTTIRFTTDASEPNDNSILYSTSINIPSSTVIRARVFREGYIPSDVLSRNYIIEEAHTLPVMSLITDPINMFDDVQGIYSYGNDFNNELPYFGANFWKDEERPIHISYYGTDNELKVALNAGVKIFGGWSRAFDQRSLSLFARSKYGPSDIEYPLFDERIYNKYGAVVLRNSGNDNIASNMRDIINHELNKDLNLETQAYQSVVTYINDEYWGLYHLREKVNEHFLANKFNIDPDSLDLLEFGGEVIHGSNEEYFELLNMINNEDLENDVVYDEIKSKIDIDNLLDYFATQIYIDNTDWPGNNIKFWKPKNNGKWRWILYDTDFGLNLFNPFGHFNNTLAFALEPNGPEWPNPPWSTELFRGLVSNESFRIKLVNRFADFMNSRYTTENIRNIVSQKTEELEDEMIRHYARWNANIGEWYNQINRINQFADLRPAQMKNHIRNQFNLPDVHRITINNSENEKGYVIISTLTINDELWSGEYFENNPYSISAIANPGYRFSHWTGSVNSSNPALSINMTNDMTLIPHFEQDLSTELKPIINEINYKSIEAADAGDWIEIYNPSNIEIALTDWSIRDENDDNVYNFPTLSILPNEYVIIVNDEEKFSQIHPSIEYLETLGFGLSSNDQVRLYDADGILIDSVDYNDNFPWPVEANGEGFTLELIDPLLDNNLAVNYDNINLYGSPGSENILQTNNNNVQLNFELSLYPNPSSDFLNIAYSSDGSDLLDLSIIDALGRIVYGKKNILSGIEKNVVEIKVAHLASGAYQLKATNRNGNETVVSWIKL